LALEHIFLRRHILATAGREWQRDSSFTIVTSVEVTEFQWSLYVQPV